MNKPKFSLNDIVHINETSGVGRVASIEWDGRKYRYTVEYFDGKKKTAYEQDLIKVQ